MTLVPLGEVNPEVPEELARLVERMTAFHPEERFSTPGEAADALEACLPRANTITVEMEPVVWPSPPTAPLAPVAPLAPPEDLYAAEEFPDLTPFAPERSEAPVILNPELAFTDAPPGLAGDAPVVAPPAPRQAKQQALKDPRDWMLLFFGAGGLLVVQGVAWLLGYLLRAR